MVERRDCHMSCRILSNGFRVLCAMTLAAPALLSSTASRAEPPPKFVYRMLEIECSEMPALEEDEEITLQVRCAEDVIPTPPVNKCLGYAARLATDRGRLFCWSPGPERSAARQIPPPLPPGGTCPYAGCDDAALAVPKIITSSRSSEFQIAWKCLSTGESAVLVGGALICTPTPRALVKAVREACTSDPRKPGCTLRPKPPGR